MSNDIFNTLKSIMEPYVEDESILETLQPDSNIMESLKVDSVDLVEIVLDIEEKFNIQIEDQLIEKMRTPQDIVNVIQEKMA